MHRERSIYPALLLVTAAVLWPVAHCEFINLDDWTHVVTNDAVRQGLTPETVGWAFRTTDWANWQPLTWLSHMLDCQLFGLNAGAHHLVNLFWHVANTLLLFHLLRRITRELWPSALVAALFALHPLHVESVAWISERKDVLSTFFGLLTLLLYARYARSLSRVGPRRSAALPDHHSATVDYLLALLFFALGLMSKPMLVTWPFVLLLLDFWPLQRVSRAEPSSLRFDAPGSQGPGWRRLLLEKVPFFALSIATSAITVFAQQNSGATISVSRLTFSQRIDNALVAYIRYLVKTFWPENLAAFYPYPFKWPEWQTFGSAALLLLLTIAVILQARRRPFLAFGWLWFLGTLVPVIGLVQVGGQSLADRYMYIPSIGLFVMVIWGLKGFAGSWRPAPVWMATASAAALAGCMIVTSLQVRYWRSSETLFRHTLEVTTNNIPAEYLLGDALIKLRKVDEGMEHLAQALRLNPSFAPAHAKMAEILSRHIKFREAIEHYRAILSSEPDTITVLNNLAWMLATNPDPEIRDGPEAVRLAEHACELTRYQVAVCVGTLAAAYAEAGRYPDAIRTGENARALALAAVQTDLARKNEELLQLYRQGRPCREVPPGPVAPTSAGSAPP